MTEVAGRLADWAVSVRAEVLPDAARAAAVRCLVDATGVALAALDRPVVLAAQRLAAAQAAPGACSLIGRQQTLGGPGAAQANATAIHALDFDDTSYAGTLHGTAVVWPAVLAAAELAGASGADTLAAFVAGVETAYALGNDLTDQRGGAIYDRGWWTTPLLGQIGAAAGAARALGLGQARTRDAIAIAAAQAFGTRAVMGSAAKPYLCGQAAGAGLMAALAAQAGIDGPADAFASRFGLATLTGVAPPDWRAVGALGRGFALLDPGIAFKRYPVCSSAQAGAEAVEALRAATGIGDSDVAQVACAVTPMVAACLPFGAPQTIAEAQFSLPFAIASMLVHGALTPGQLHPAVLADPRLRQAMAKVSMTVDHALAATPADRRDRPEATVVTIGLADGRRLKQRIDAATGMPTNPIADAQLDAKFLHCASAALPAAEAEALLGRLRGLAGLPSIRDLYIFHQERP